jgi:hypothetical protein
MSQVDSHILLFVNLCSSLIQFTDKTYINQPWERSPQERRTVQAVVQINYIFLLDRFLLFRPYEETVS